MSAGAHDRPDADDDASLLLALRAGDEEAFARFAASHRATMLRVARAYVASDAVAEEVVQDTWIGLLRGLDRFEGRSSLKTYLYRILVNRAQTRGQREARSIPFSSLAAEGEEGAPTVAPDRFGPGGGWTAPPRPFELPEERMAAIELRAHLRAALAKLPDRQGIVVSLHDVEGLSSEEVAEVLSITPGNVRVLLHRGRARLQAELAEYVLGDGDGDGDGDGEGAAA